MKLTRFYKDNKVTPGVFADDNTIIDCSSFGEDWNETFFENDGLARLDTYLSEKRVELPSLPASDVTLAPAIARPSKIVCIGLNYALHAKESGMEPPTEPVVFFKSTSAWTGPNDPIVIPRHSEKTDWEVELAVVIGKKAKYVSKENALDYVAGYALHNDYSERAWQLEMGGQWVKGKSADTYAPFGPFLATSDEIADPNNLNLWLSVNGEKLQDSTTADFIFNVQHVIAYLSEFMTLLPGDVISTGTPAGVGLGLDPPRYLQEGDIVELGIDGLGTQRQVATKEA
ncbi:fumarylacetoacetate hydrolase family protein [Rubritalea tangerina]|uniref:Fumarylacetoacetate hydrolase family protein n=1 Tax=Rubritalea tangerina TaxID=430798 RepID=A0ABW4Z7I0_9BACT